MTENHGFDLGGGNALAAGDVNVGDAINNFEVSVGIPVDQVAGVQPAVAKCCRGEVWFAEIAGEHARATHKKLPRCLAL